MREMEGKVVLVTGAARGIGLATARRLAAEGARVAMLDAGTDIHGAGADDAIVDEAARALRELGHDVAASAMRVHDHASAEAAVAWAVRHFGRLDALVTSAGFVVDRSLLSSDGALFDDVLATHLIAPFSLTRAAARVMVDAKSAGAIVHLGSPSAFFGARGQATISAAQAGLVALARSAALELRRHRIRVNVVLPSARTRTTEELPIFASIREDSMSPEHVGAVVAYLCCDRAEDIHGEAIGVAGSRLYVVRSRETTGDFGLTPTASLEEIAKLWQGATRS